VVDLDLEKFFDRVNHDVLMARVARRVKDKCNPSICSAAGCRVTMRDRRRRFSQSYVTSGLAAADCGA
jgi:hypothetical protein